jgi:hypothetical protein
MKRTIAVLMLLVGQIATAQKTNSLQAKPTPAPTPVASQHRHRVYIGPPPVVWYAPTWKSAVATGFLNGLVGGIFSAALDAAAREDNVDQFGPGKFVPHQEAPPAPSTMASVSITSIPAGATVKIFGTVIGQTPLKTRLAPGPYTARASLPGYVDSEAAFEIEPNGDTQFEVTLVPADRSARENRQQDSGVVTLQ